ncbi:MAG: hypothetical protein Q9193_001956 [Seirophora villosa]
MEPVQQEELPHGLLRNAYDRALIVRMDDLQFQDFSGLTSVIGTYALRSCSVVIVASRLGAILAHIAPLGDDYARSMMDRFEDLYQLKLESHFGKDRHPWLVTGLMQIGGHTYEEALADTNVIINKRLVIMDLEPSSMNYTFQLRSAQDSPQFPGKGTVFVDGKDGILKIYVEDQLVHSS